MNKLNLSFKSLAAVFMMSAAVVATSCKKDKDEDKGETPSLSINPFQTEVKFKADGSADGNATFTVATNQSEWNAVANKTWVTVNKTATGFTLVAAENTAVTAPEAANVTVSAGTATSVVLAVTQAAAAPTLALTPAEQTAIAFAADGTADGNVAFTVSTNQASWDAVSDQTWVTVTKTEIGFTVSATPQTLDAAATLTVSANGAADIVLNLTIEGLGVEINGVVWAKRNVDDFGTFAATPEAPGKFYQWNRIAAWDATGAVTGWDATTPEGNNWAEENDPSPEGWRVPTEAELNKLLDSEKVSQEWVTTPAIGRLFTDIASGNTLFLPAAGYRSGTSSLLNHADTYGYYWSSTVNAANADRLLFSSGDASVGSDGRRTGFPVRSVAE
ncbi:hypothetical protein AGMMS4956_20260 [Bacteroidia bacterium]|nr:hypothetical protein AGMMS4956_20260 [Bacteroidia bacterium]